MGMDRNIKRLRKHDSPSSRLTKEATRMLRALSSKGRAHFMRYIATQPHRPYGGGECQ
jgi:hypothetical protein